MTGSRSVVIVGAGIVGAALAYHLASAGSAVTMIERSKPASGVTARSFAWISVVHGNAAIHARLRNLAIADYHRLERELNGALAVDWNGALTWSADPTESERLVAEHTAWGYDVRLVEKDEIRRLEPHLDVLPKVAAYVAGEGALDPVAATMTLVDAAIEAGATIIYGTVVKALVNTDDRVAGVVLSSGTVEADVVVIAAGTGSTSVLSHQNIRINGFQFAACIVDVHLPIHASLTPVDISGPGGDFAAQSLEVAETPAVEALAGHGAQLAFRDIQPASVLGCVAEHGTANQRPRLFRLKPFVESTFRVRVEVVADQDDPGARCVTAIEQPGDLLCPIAFRPARAGRGLPPSRQRFAEHEHRCRTGTFVFVVDPARAIPGGGYRRTSLPDQLYRLFVHAEHRTIGIQGSSVGLEHLLHMRRKFGVSVRRDHPVGDLPLAHPVFFSVRRSVSRLTDSTILSSTT